MQILSEVFGFCVTKCYILKFGGVEVVIDPGDGASEWVAQNTQNLQAILLTHAHFDHNFDAAKIRRESGAKIYCPKEDEFMCENDPFGYLKESFKSDVLVEAGEVIEVCGQKFAFHHFAGHTPGCSMIEAENGVVFSGDFIFKDSIGRFDFPYSDREKMKQSLTRVLEFQSAFGWQGELTLYSGHTPPTTLSAELSNIRHWLSII